MPTKEHDVPLDDVARNWIRLRFTTVGGGVTAFLVQYETIVGGERLPVVRYDGVHGFAHRDRLNRRGEVVDKQPLAGALSFAEALQIGEQDIRANWRHYRQAFLRGKS